MAKDKQPFFLFRLPALLTLCGAALTFPFFFQPTLPLLILSLVNIAVFSDLWQPHQVDDSKKRDGKAPTKDEVKENVFNSRVTSLLFSLQVIFVLAHDYLWIQWRVPLASSLPDPLPLELLGALLVIGGAALRGWSRTVLGKFFTYQVAIRDKHQLITAAPYNLMLHPAYTGGLLIHTGLVLYYWLSPVFIFEWIFVAFIFLPKRVPLEEKALEEEFGEAFRQRRKKVARFIPFIY